MKFLLQHNIIKLREPLYFFTIILLMTLVSRDFYLRLDFSSDRRHSLTKTSRKFIKALNDEVKIKIYLDGEMTFEYEKFRNSIEEFMHVISEFSPKISYKFVNISSQSLENRRSIFKMLKKSNFYGKSVFYKDKGLKKEKVIFPYAKISCAGKYKIINLISGVSEDISIRLNQSLENLEFEILNSIKALTIKEKKRIAILEGIGEPSKIYIADFVKVLKENFDVTFVDTNSLSELGAYDALVVHNLSKEFSEEQKYHLDQYIMNGGKSFFFVNTLTVDRSRLEKGIDFAMPLKNDINGLLFKYGIRINYDLIEGLNSTFFPVVIGTNNKKPEIEWLRWPLFPILNNFSKNILTKNLGALSVRFANSIDFIKQKGLKHHSLVTTSKTSRALSTPVQIQLNDLRKEPIISKYIGGPYTVMALVEGEFSSYFKNRFIPENVDKSNFKEKIDQNTIFVCSSSSFILNDVDPSQKKIIKLGYDPYFNHVFANRDFIRNLFSYIVDDNSLIFSKNKRLKIRLLNQEKVKKVYYYIKTINILIPLLLLVIIGLGFYFFHKKNYSNFQKLGGR